MSELADRPEAAGVLLFSAAVGFGVYCLAWAAHVWRARNAKAESRDAAVDRGSRRLRRAGAAAAAAGAATAAVAVILTLAGEREGVLTAKDLFAVRVPENVEVAEVTAAERVAAGDVVARFRSPEKEANAAALELKEVELAAERRAVLAEPLAVDPEITRELGEVSAQLRHAETTLSDITLERGRLLRELSREVLGRRDEIHRLGTELESLREELEQARATHDLREKEIGRVTELQARRAATEQALDEARRAAEVAAAEVRRLESKREMLERQRADLDRGLAELTAQSETHSAGYEREIARLEEDTARLRTRRGELLARLEADRARAERNRRERVAQLDAELRQATQEREGLTESLRAVAPAAGRVVYRDPSPGTVTGDAPLLVIGPADGLRLRIRLPRWEERALRADEAVTLELLPRLDETGDVRERVVERRFPGRLASWRPLPHDARYALAELVCDPPAEAVRSLVAGEQVAVRPASWPLVVANPDVAAGGLLAAVGAGVWLFGVVLRPRGAALPRAPAQDPGSGRGLKHGAEGTMLFLLGTRLREAIDRDEVERELTASVRWALDRHGPRAVRLIGEGLGDPEELDESLRRLVDHRASDPLTPPAGDDVDRDLARILKAVGTEAVQHQARRLARLVREHRARAGLPRPEDSGEFVGPHWGSDAAGDREGR